MKKELQSAITQFKDNNFFDVDKTEKLFLEYKDLYEKSKKEFFKTCPICYEISSYDSFCNCKIECETLCDGCEEITVIDSWYECKENACKRADLKNFIDIYEEYVTMVKNKDELQPSGASLSDFDELTPEEKAVFSSMRGLPAPITRNTEDENQNNIINTFVRGFQNQLEKYPTASFNGLMAAITDLVGYEQVDKGFNLYAEAFNKVTNNSLSQQDIQDSYNRIFGNVEEDFGKVNISNQSQESNPVVETKAIESSLEPKIEKLNAIIDLILPIILYLVYISIPIGIFFNTYFKDVFNFRDNFSFNTNGFYEDDVDRVSFFLSLIFLGGLYLIKEIHEKNKNPFIKILYSKKSIKFHLIVSFILIAIALYYLTIAIALIILIWSLVTLDKYSFKWQFQKTVFYKWVTIIFKKIKQLY